MNTPDTIPRNCMNLRIWDYEGMAAVLHSERQLGKQRGNNKGKEVINTNAFCLRYGLPLGLPYQHFRSYIRHKQLYLELLRANLRESNQLNKFLGHPGDSDLKLIAHLDQLVDNFFLKFYTTMPKAETELKKIMEEEINFFIRTLNLSPLFPWKLTKRVEKKGESKEEHWSFMDIFRELLVVTNKLTIAGYDLFYNKVNHKLLPVFPDLIPPEPVPAPVEILKEAPHPIIFVGTLPLPTYFICIPDSLYHSQLTSDILGLLAASRLAFRLLDIREHPDFNARAGYKYLVCDLIYATVDDQIKKLISAAKGVNRSDILKNPAGNVFKTFMERSPLIETKNSAPQSGQSPSTF